MSGRRRKRRNATCDKFAQHQHMLTAVTSFDNTQQKVSSSFYNNQQKLSSRCIEYSTSNHLQNVNASIPEVFRNSNVLHFLTPAHCSSGKNGKYQYVAVAAVTTQKQSLLATWQNVMSAMPQQKQICFCIMSMDIASSMHLATAPLHLLAW